MDYLQITTKDNRYVYTTGRIRGLEKYLLKSADFARIKETKDLRESFQNLHRFYPYSESMKVCTHPEDFEKGLEEEWKKTYLELISFVPEPDLVKLFWLEQDFHNMKVLFKLHLQKKVPEEIDKVDKDIINQIMDTIEKGISAKEIDVFLDKVYFQKFSLELEKYKDDFLIELGKKIIDSLNIKNFLRVKLWKREDEKKLLEDFIIDGGNIEKEIMIQLAGEPLDSLVGAIKRTEYVPVFQKALEEWKQSRSLFSLDKSLEEIVLAFTHKGFYITFGREPLVNYILLKKKEIRDLRFILRAKKAGISSW